MNHKKIGMNEEAVSPVIGVILMVAITVILAAIIAQFVYGMAGGIKTAKNVAVSAQQPEQTKIVVMYQGGQDSQEFAYGNVKITPGTGSMEGTITYENGTTIGPTGQRSILSNIVGNSVTATTTGNFAGGDHVVVTGTFGDSSAQVLLDTYL